MPGFRLHTLKGEFKGFWAVTVRANWRVLGVYFPWLDTDFYIPALLEGIFGSQKWMAARLGAKGGRVKSLAKSAAARANGRLGGRPPKLAAMPG